MTILVTGATGFIGRHLVEKLLECGSSVRVVTRDPERLPSQWRGRLEVVAGSLLDKGVQEAATKDVGLVYHLAGEIRDPSSMRAINVEAVRDLLEAAALAGVKRIVYVSSVGVIGAVEPGVVTEETPCRPRTLYEQTKLEGERIVLEFARSGKIEAMVLRPTIVFGDGVERNKDGFLEWLRAVQQERFVFIGKKSVANYVYVGDVVEAMVRVAESPVRGSAIYIVADPAPMREFVGAMAQALGVTAPTRSLPVWAAYVLGASLQAASRILGTPAPLTLSRAIALSSATLFSGEKLSRGAVIALPFGYRKGLDLTVRWYREAGRL
nr:NAD-dependent epimerase/dehydratase family protein [Nitrospirota bacterium]